MELILACILGMFALLIGGFICAVVIIAGALRDFLVRAGRYLQDRR